MTEHYTAPNGRRFKVVNGWVDPMPIKAVAKKKAHRAIPRPLDGEPVASGTLLLNATPPSVNALFFNRARGRGKTLLYRNWCIAAALELRNQPSWHVPGKVEIRTLIPATTRGDADNRIKATLDCLVTAGRIEDDKNVAKVSAEFAAGEATVIHIRSHMP